MFRFINRPSSLSSNEIKTDSESKTFVMLTLFMYLGLSLRLCGSVTSRLHTSSLDGD
jgi:hypothetical protein